MRTSGPRHTCGWEGPNVANDRVRATEPAIGVTDNRRPGDGPAPHRELVYRHSVVVRCTHWINLVCLTVLLMSDLQIFNAHPALYWGNLSNFDHPILEMTSEQPQNEAPKGITTVFGHRIETTGV